MIVNFDLRVSNYLKSDKIRREMTDFDMRTDKIWHEMTDFDMKTDKI